MTTKYNNVYINNTSTVTGPYENEGPLTKLFDLSYKDFYFNQTTWEQAEIQLQIDTLDIILQKENKTKLEIDLLISGDLLNQLAASNYAAAGLGIPHIGVYAACATSVLEIILAANMLEAHQLTNVICITSSHNNGAEKQFRYPVEYGGPKPKTATFTVTGSAAAYLSRKSTGIKVESSTIGEVVDSKITDVYNMGGVMAKAAADTIYKHLIETNRKVDYYDLILTGDLGIYGKEILKEYMHKEYNIELVHYEDSGTLIYDRNKQPVYAGASGPACVPLVTYTYIFSQMNKKHLKKVLIVATGALMNQTMVNQKLTIPAIAHAVSVEVIK